MHLRYLSDAGGETLRPSGPQWHAMLLYHPTMDEVGGRFFGTFPIKNKMVKLEEN